MLETSKPAPRPLPGPLVFFLSLLVLCTVAALLFVLEPQLGPPRPFNYLVPPGFGSDFWIYFDRMRLVHRAAFFTSPGYPWTYPAPAAPLYALLYVFCLHEHWFWGWRVLCLVTLGGCAFAIVRLAQAARTRYAAPFFLLTLLLSWPVYISLQRGNTESLLWLVLAAGIWCFAQERWTAAAVLIGVAGSFKLYPILCLGLFLGRKRWKEVGLGVAVATVVTAASLWFINPDLVFAFRGVTSGVHTFTVLYAGGIGLGQAIYDHSAFELVKYLGHPPPAVVAHWMSMYVLVSGTVMLLLFLRVMQMPVLNQVLFLLVAGVLLPPSSFDYTLQNLYIPWAWIALLLMTRRFSRTPIAYLLMGLFAVEFAPMHFVTHHTVPVNGLIKCGGLLGLLLCSVVFPMPRVGENDASPALASA